MSLHRDQPLSQHLECHICLNFPAHVRPTQALSCECCWCDAVAMLDFVVHKNVPRVSADSPRAGATSRIMLLENGASDKGRFLHRYIANLRQSSDEFSEHCWFVPSHAHGYYIIDDVGAKILCDCVPRPIIGRCRRNAIACSYKTFSQFL